MSTQVLSPNSLSETDLFLIVTTENNSTLSRVANAGACDNRYRPTIGRI
jgi:hypothetical protein